jgi:hypothetical protein
VPRSSDSKLKIGYLGPPIDHRENLAMLLGSAGIDLQILDDSITSGIYRDASGAPTRSPAKTMSGAMRRLKSQLFGTSNRAYIERLTQQIDVSGLQCLIGYWGAQILGDLIAIKKHRPHVVTILNVLCHPTALTGGKIAAQNALFSRSLKYLDGVIASGRVMHEYLKQHVYRGRDVPTLIAPPMYASHYFPPNIERPMRDAANLLFLGRTDWNRGQESDDIGVFLTQLLEEGIEVYHAHSDHVTPHPKRHMFAYLPLAPMERFARQFDASLVLYNLNACARPDRFRVTVPDRLIASVTAGLPIALPPRGYDAATEYLARYEAVINFSSPADLAAQLRDRSRVQALRKLAEANSAHYIGEKHVSSLVEFITQRLSTVRAVR